VIQKQEKYVICQIQILLDKYNMQTSTYSENTYKDSRWNCMRKQVPVKFSFSIIKFIAIMQEYRYSILKKYPEITSHINNIL